MKKAIISTGQIIEITKIFKGLGKYQGEECDLLQYSEEGVKHLIESPLVER